MSAFRQSFPARAKRSLKRNREASRKLVKVSAEHGWGEYRTPVIYQDDVMNV
jgi:4-cresol dehydrogenase (hydroxylating)